MFASAPGNCCASLHFAVWFDGTIRANRFSFPFLSRGDEELKPCNLSELVRSEPYERSAAEGKLERTTLQEELNKALDKSDSALTDWKESQQITFSHFLRHADERLLDSLFYDYPQAVSELAGWSEAGGRRQRNKRRNQGAAQVTLVLFHFVG